MLAAVNGAPLLGLPARGGDGPSAEVAMRLLGDLGAAVTMASGDTLWLADQAVRHRPTTAEQDWQASGLAELCGRASGPALMPTGRPATLARGAGLAIELLTGVSLATTALLGERAAILGLSRNGATSAGGAARLLRTADGWLVLNLPRASDLELVPALTEAAGAADPWAAVEVWAASTPTAAAVERCVLLGLAAGAVTESGQRRPARPWSLRRVPATAGPVLDRPRTVVNLGALWAAPLCAQLLRRCGMTVTDVESTGRPDVTPAEFYRVLHEGHRRVRVDFSSAAGRSKLAGIIADADVVIEASRPRALQSLGVTAETVLGDGRRRVWLRITGHGRETNRIAFGDDAAATAGLLGWDPAGPVFAGDAIADPLTGILGALAVSGCAGSPDSWIVDLAMSDVCRYAVSRPGRATGAAVDPQSVSD